MWSGVRGGHGVAREKERKKQLSNEIIINFLKKRWGIVKMEEKKISNNRQRDKFTILISYWLKLLRKLSLFLILFNNKLRLFLCQTQFGRCLLQRVAQKPPIGKTLSHSAHKTPATRPRRSNLSCHLVAKSIVLWKISFFSEYFLTLNEINFKRKQPFFSIFLPWMLEKIRHLFKFIYEEHFYKFSFLFARHNWTGLGMGRRSRERSRQRIKLAEK